jgi:hypothetical protein
LPAFVRPILLIAALLPAMPATAFAAGTGGASAPAAPESARTVEAGGVELSARPASLLGRAIRFRGQAGASHSGRAVSIERFVQKLGEWEPIAETTVAEDGTFAAKWRATRLGTLRFRALVTAPDGAIAAGAVPEVEVTVHRPAMATWFGPGFYGRQTACGQRMTPTLLGVAHRTLPCGSSVAMLYRGRTITVPVVDRGPFHDGIAWDLTAAAAEAIGFTYTDRIGALRVLPPGTDQPST